MHRPSSRAALALATLAAGAALGTAFAFEWWGGLVPCALCLVERWPWRIALALGLLGLIMPPLLVRGALLGMLLAGLAATGIAGTHVGVEFGWWPSPLPECAAPQFEQGSIAARLRSMPERPAKPCDDPVYVIPAIPVSFAEAGLIYAVLFSAGIVAALAVSGAKPR
jgi:disulfide bond formation protein DsbB